MLGVTPDTLAAGWDRLHTDCATSDLRQECQLL